MRQVAAAVLGVGFALVLWGGWRVLYGPGAPDEATGGEVPQTASSPPTRSTPVDSGRVQPVTFAQLPVPEGLQPDEHNTIEIFRRASEAVVFVQNNEIRRGLFSLDASRVPRGTGSGFVWDRRGHIVTNLHVIRGGNDFAVMLSGGNTYSAEVVGFEARKDLAVLRVDAPEGELTPLVAGRSSELVVGQKVLAIGNPFGLDMTLTTGVISALGREIPSDAGVVIEDVIQTDASINPGNSGGPLLDSSGRLIGVNTAIFSPTGSSAGIGFAVPVDTVADVVPQLIEHGRVRRAGLGITVLPDHIARRLGTTGVIVRAVSPDSPAASIGLRSLRVDRRGRLHGFDVITGIDDREIADFSDLALALERHAPGNRVSVTYESDGERREGKAELIRIE